MSIPNVQIASILIWTAALASPLFGLPACSGGDGGDGGGGTKQREPRTVSVGFERETLLETSVLRFEMRGTQRVVPKSARVRFEGRQGTFADLETWYAGEATREGDVGDLVVEIPVEKTLWPELEPQDGDVFSGRIVVELHDELGVFAHGAVAEAKFTFRRDVAPQVSSVDVGEVHVNEAVSVRGAGFLRPQEGETVAVIRQGTLERPDGSTTDLTGERVPLSWAGQRDRADLRLDPGVFGVRRSSFEAVLKFENVRSDSRTISGEGTVEISGAFQQTYIAKLAPSAGSRGQKIAVRGRGFVPSDEENGYGMLLRYEGKFIPSDEDRKVRDYTGAKAIERIPYRVVAEDEIAQNIWYSVEDRQLRGLGSTPGVFDGEITPILFDESGEQEGLGWQGEFRVLPTKQVVYLKYLPSFSKALEKYGLRNVERAIRDRVLEVMRRDYAGYHLEVREEKPDDFIDYATVELGGPDPTGTRAFGYDNSFNDVAKDTGNLFLADYLGGVNADAAEEFNNPYGGIFIESFTFFSPTLNENNSYASEKFDEILRPFMPELGGTPVRGTEWPDGSRTDAIERAIHMAGSVIGNTVTHEVGHSLGMTFVNGDFVRPQNVFHNELPGEYIMDPGSERPFAERAELPGAGRAHFNALNKEYLDKVLPEPQ